MKVKHQQHVQTSADSAATSRRSTTCNHCQTFNRSKVNWFAKQQESANLSLDRAHGNPIVACLQKFKEENSHEVQLST